LEAPDLLVLVAFVVRRVVECRGLVGKEVVIQR
jgi:hypothetical protein